MTWADCLPLETEFAGVHPANLAGLVRLAGRTEVTRLYSPDGKYRGLYPGDAARGLLADEAGAAYLRGELPAEPIPIGPDTGWGDAVTTAPYSGPLTVLIVTGMGSLVKASVWAHRRPQVVRFGGMPVLSYVDDPQMLADVPWRQGDNVLVRNAERRDMLPPLPVPVEVMNG